MIQLIQTVGASSPTRAPPPDPSVPWLTRRFGDPTMQANLPTKADEQAALNEVPYDLAPWNRNSAGPAGTPGTHSFRNFLEGWIGPGLHNAAHMWVGGSIMPGTSPDDPVFFLHHANVHRIWANWHRKFFKAQDYLPVSGGNQGHNLADPMSPWGGTSTPQSVLSTFALGIGTTTLLHRPSRR